MKIFLLSPTLTFLFFVSVNGLSSDYKLNSNCSKGISYWCNNLINAKQCRAVDFCITTVWETHRVQNDSNLICDDCKEWVDKARSFIKKQENSEEIISSLKWTCDLIPVASIASSCEKVVDENVPEILKMLESAMDSDAICSKLFFCNNAEYSKTLIKVQPKETTKLLTCNQCKVFGYLMERKFNETSKDDLLENLLGVCGEILSFSDCSKVVMMRFNKIYDALGTILKSNSLCNKSEICKSDQNNLIPGNVPSIISLCHFCLHFIKELDEKYIVNKTEIEFKSNLENFCDLIEPYSSKCEEFADQYYDAIYKYLSSKSNVTEFCYSIKICKRKHFIEHEGISTTINKKFISEADFLKKFDESSLIIHKNGSWCNTCQSLLRSIIGKLDEYSTEDEMVKTLKYVCKQLPSVIQNECENIVDLYADAIIWLLDRSLDPNFICPKIKLCPHILDLEHLQSTAIDDKPTCSFCLFTVQEIYDFVSGRKIKENIENAMTMLCNHLSGKLLSQCLEFSTNFSEKIVEMIMADIPPQEACMEIKLCHNQVEPYEETTEIKIYNPNEIQTENPMTEHPQCVLCEFIMSVLQTELNDINVDIKIKQIVHNFCHKMPTTVTSYCRNFIDFYFERIIELLKIIKPSQICSTMKLCLHRDD